jgi:hypothetical protein
MVTRRSGRSRSPSRPRAVLVPPPGTLAGVEQHRAMLDALKRVEDACARLDQLIRRDGFRDRAVAAELLGLLTDLRTKVREAEKPTSPPPTPQLRGRQRAAWLRVRETYARRKAAHAAILGIVPDLSPNDLFDLVARQRSGRRLPVGVARVVVEFIAADAAWNNAVTTARRAGLTEVEVSWVLLCPSPERRSSEGCSRPPAVRLAFPPHDAEGGAARRSRRQCAHSSRRISWRRFVGPMTILASRRLSAASSSA